MRKRLFEKCGITHLDINVLLDDQYKDMRSFVLTELENQAFHHLTIKLRYRSPHTARYGSAGCYHAAAFRDWQWLEVRIRTPSLGG